MTDALTRPGIRAAEAIAVATQKLTEEGVSSDLEWSVAIQIETDEPLEVNVAGSALWLRVGGVEIVTDVLHFDRSEDFSDQLPGIHGKLTLSPGKCWVAGEMYPRDLPSGSEAIAWLELSLEDNLPHVILAPLIAMTEKPGQVAAYVMETPERRTAVR